MSYYDLSRPYSIDDWNNLLNDVNDKLQNPPEGDEACEPIDPVDEVTDPYIWSVDDVEVVRNKLIETCPDISFSEPLEIWTPEIIDEIETALGEVWCDCCDEEWLHEEDGTEIELFTYSPEVSSNCFGYPDGQPVRLRNIIDGMSVGKSGIENRRWEIWSSFGNLIVGGTISCEGEIEYTGSKWYPTTWGIYVGCGLCNDFCQSGIDLAEAELVDWVDYTWTLQILTSGAECADCDE